ncbi:MAG: phosphatase PAP2 family protein [Ferruginibacter sp.]|nr:phosphatase PAP2 family protein [Ferruginibacter sp.]
MIKNFHFSFLKKLSLSVLLMIALFVLCLWGLFIVADMIFADKDLSFDERVFEIIKPYESNANTAVMQVVTFLGSQKFLLPANLLLIGYYIFWKDNRATAFKITTISLTSVVVMFTIKFLLQRQRPLVPLIAKVHGYSFPSGHTFSSVTFYGIIGYLIYKNVKPPILKWMLIGLTYLFIFMVGFSRVYLRLHYASDVIAGFCLGLIWLLLARWFLVKTEKSKLQQNL